MLLLFLLPLTAVDFFAIYPSGGPVHVHTHMPPSIPNRSPIFFGFSASISNKVPNTIAVGELFQHLELSALARIKQVLSQAHQESCPQVLPTCSLFYNGRFIF